MMSVSQTAAPHGKIQGGRAAPCVILCGVDNSRTYAPGSGFPLLSPRKRKCQTRARSSLAGLLPLTRRIGVPDRIDGILQCWKSMRVRTSITTIPYLSLQFVVVSPRCCRKRKDPFPSIQILTISALFHSLLFFSLRLTIMIWRDVRHNPCIMAPATVVMMLIVCTFWTVAFIWQFPIFALGFVMSPFLQRQQFLIEFLYPSSLGRSAHLWLVKFVSISRISKKSGDKNRRFHSRSLETRVEIIPGRVFLHPLPQLLDNLGYLVVCVPDENAPVSAVSEKQSSGKITITSRRNCKIVAFLVDCGNAAEVVKQIDLISEAHYNKQKITVQSILSTHKHHDHTAGNVSLKNQMESIKLIVGGAVEKVPGCNFEVTNGDKLPLPKDGANRMDDCIQVEAIATPGHTRGSITYVLRPLVATDGLAYLFTGDTMFCGGAGVPFEADIDPDQEAKDQKRDFRSLIKASASTHAVERCLVEIMVRSVPLSQIPGDKTSERVFLMPGHEYTGELLSRQFSTETTKWKSVTPSTFFEAASQFYVALHRRTLPHSSGKLLCAVGSPLQREMAINPYLRTLRTRGELVLQAIEFWHTQFCRKKVPDWISPSEQNANGISPRKRTARKTPATLTQWNLDRSDLNRPVFTTVYSVDLETVIQDLAQGRVSAATAAQRLRDMSTNLEQPVLTRRPVPGTMPSDRNVYRGLLALVLLGSAPNALTYVDAERMKLPDPVQQSSDLPVSKRRLITILRWLNLIANDNEGRRHVAMINQLWQESMEDSGTALGANYDATDLEASQIPDAVCLGDLKWSIYGVPREPPSSLSFCLPCIPCGKQPRKDSSHPVHKSGLKPSSGELVRHDVVHCFMCQSMAGCPLMENQEGMGDDRPVLAQYGSTDTFDEDDGADEGSFVEVTATGNEFLHI